MVSRRLFADWRARLISLQDPVDPRSVHASWLRRIYLRVLTFLVNCYGSEVDAAPLVSPFAPRKVSSSTGEPTAPETEPASASTMPLVVAAVVGEGKPPRDAATIRSVLDAVHRDVPAAEVGPLATGFSPDDTIVVASFYRVFGAEQLQKTLRTAAIKSTVQALDRRFAVYVRMADLTRARPLVTRHTSYLRYAVPHRRNYESTWPGIGMLVGAALGVMAAVVLLFSARWVSDPNAVIVLAIAAPFVGLVAGFILGLIASER